MQDNHSRFVGSLKKKFVEQEMDSLQQRTSATSRTGQPFAECLVRRGAKGKGDEGTEGKGGRTVWGAPVRELSDQAPPS